MSRPIGFEDILDARARIGPSLAKTPLRNYGPLDAEVGSEIRVFVRH